MRIVPKKTKYHYAFRNKIQTKKITKYEHRIKGSLHSECLTLINFFEINAWIHRYPFKNNSYSLCQRNTTANQGIKAQTTKHRYLSHNYTNRLLFGTYGIVFEEHGKLSAKFVETIHLDIAKMLKKKSKVWLRICCDTPVTARPAETRMGKGKGAISYWEAKVFPGQVFFEFSGLTIDRAEQILANLQRKSSIGLKLILYYSE